MRVVLCALTGFGNEILPALLADPRVELAAVFTRRFPTPFPFYEIPQLHELCLEKGVACHDDLIVSEGAGFEALRAYRPDLILVSAFHQILRENVLALPPLGTVNLHPSLLPLYRGADPIQAAILDGAERTGITYLSMTREIDAGDVFLQASCPIGPRDTIGSLRLGLARLGARELPRLLDLFDGGKTPKGVPQSGPATDGRKRYREVVRLDTSRPLYELDRLVRAVVPSPGAVVEVDGAPRAVRGCEFVEAAAAPGPGALDLVRNGVTLRLFFT